mgnify:CR=1 FL=1
MDHDAMSVVRTYGADVLASEGMQQEKNLPHHGGVSCYDHSVSVAMVSVRIARRLPFRVNMRSLVRGALLHDFYLYDWHVHDPLRAHRLHGFLHPGRAFRNARAVLSVNKVERDIILRHMFPLTPLPPRHRESWIVTAADKYCTFRETVMANPVFLENRRTTRE